MFCKTLQSRTCVSIIIYLKLKNFENIMNVAVVVYRLSVVLYVKFEKPCKKIKLIFVFQWTKPIKIEEVIFMGACRPTFATMHHQTHFNLLV